MIDDFYDPFSRLTEYDALTDLRMNRILLLPTAEVARARNRARGEGGDFIDGGIDHVYGTMPARGELADAGWTVMDTSDLTAEQTRDRALGLLHP